MEAQESNLITEIRKTTRRYQDAVAEYQRLTEKSHLVNSEILYNISELEKEILYLRFHLRYLASQLHKFDMEKLVEEFKKFTPKEKNKWRIFKTIKTQHQK